MAKKKRWNWMRWLSHAQKLFDAHQYRKAIRAVERAKALVGPVDPQDETPFYTVHFWLGEMHLDLDQYEDALKNFDLCLSCPSNPPKEELLEIEYQRLVCLMALDESSASLILALELLRQYPASFPEHVILMAQISILYHRLGEIAEGLRQLEKAKELAQGEIDIDTEDYSVVWLEISNAELVAGQYRECLITLDYLNSLLGEHSKYTDVRSEYLENKYELYYELGLYKRAQAELERKLEEEREFRGANHLKIAKCLSNLSMLVYEQGNTEEALSLILEALEMHVEARGANNFAYSRKLNNLGIILNQLGNGKDAVKAFKGALRLKLKYSEKEHHEISITLSNIASVYDDQRKFALACRWHRKAVASAKEIYGDNHRAYFAVLLKLGENLTWQRKWEEADSIRFACLNFMSAQIREVTGGFVARDGLQMVEDFRQELDDFLGYAFDRYPANPWILRNALNLKLKINNIVPFGNSISAELSESQDQALSGKPFNQLLEEYVFACLQGVKSETSDTNRLLLRAELEKLQGQRNIGATSRTDTTVLPSSTWQQLQELLRPAECILELVSFQQFSDRTRDWVDSIMTFGFLIFNKAVAEFPIVVPMFEANSQTLGQVKTQYLRGLSSNQRGLIDRANARLWDPLKKHLQGIETLYCVPRGPYAAINPVTLPYTEKYPPRSNIKFEQLFSLNDLVHKRLDSNRSKVSDATELEDVLNAREAKSEDEQVDHFSLLDIKLRKATPNLGEVIFIGDLDYGVGEGLQLLPLKKSICEYNHMRKCFNLIDVDPIPYTGEEATKKEIKAIQKPWVLHFATHGFFEPFNEGKSKRTTELVKQNKIVTDPLDGLEVLTKSGLCLSGANCSIPDGVLTALEIAYMDLSETELVVLSACETARGAEHATEGVLGLQRAFRAAGVRNLIATAWNVGDDVSEYFFSQFYWAWIHGQTIRQAFRMAQHTTRQKYPLVSLWGAFVLIGEPG